MPRKASLLKVTKPAKVTKTKVAAVPKEKKVEAQEVPHEVSKKERMAMQSPRKTWASIIETHFKPRSWADWSRDKLNDNRL